MQFAARLLAWLALLPALAGAAPALTPAQALAQLARDGSLSNVEVVGDLDLSAVRPAAGLSELLLDDVTLSGRLRATGGGPKLPVRLRRCTVEALSLADSHWRVPLVLVQVDVRQSAVLEDARFDAPVAWHAVRVAGPVIFKRARFAAPVELTHLRSEPQRPEGSPSFREAVFQAPVRFDHSLSTHGMAFDGARFESDVSFIGLQVRGAASFRNVQFGGDAEFRLAKMGAAHFGDERHMSVFQKLADFRRAHFGELSLDFVEVRGELLLSGVLVDRGLTLRSAALRGHGADLRGLKVGGELDFADAATDRLRLHWAGLSAPITRAKPSLQTWATLEAALSAQGHNREALQVSALRARRAFEDALQHAGPAERALLWLEEIVWGWGTVYGTRLDRALIAAIAVLALLTVPLLASRALRFENDDMRLRVRYAMQAAWTRPRCAALPLEPVPRWLATWHVVARALGLVSLAVVTLTLTRVSPVLQGLVNALVG